MAPTDAVRRFGLNNSEWLRPKPKTFFFAEFVLNEAGQSQNQMGVDSTVLSRLPLMVRTVDRPQFDLETETYNQYNRPRVVHGKVKYQTVRVIFYDDVENTALKVFNRYRNFYYGDFQNKDAERSWAYDTVSPSFEGLPSQQNWGLSNFANRDGEQSYFFKRLDIFEFYNDQFTVFNLIHPKITSFEMDPRDISEEAISETTIAVEYEGVTHQYPGIGAEGQELINFPMTQEIADKIRIPFTGGSSIRTSSPSQILDYWNFGKEVDAVVGIIKSRNPVQAAVQAVANRVLPPRLKNVRLPNSWSEAVNQGSSILSGNRSNGVVNKVTRSIRNIFG